MLGQLLRAGDGRLLRAAQRGAAATGLLEDLLIGLPDRGLAEVSAELRSRAGAGESLSELEAEAFALVREASRRSTGQRHFDCQLIGAHILHNGAIAEMATGEGKTLVALLAAYLRSLTGQGVHVVTVNDYLAARDAGLAARVLGTLGVRVGVVGPHDSVADRQLAYNADITYATSTQIGFDVLRDSMVMDRGAQVHRTGPGGRLHAAIVDEVDSILIDEARTPLQISGPGSSDTTEYYQFAAIAETLMEGQHYEVDRVREIVRLTAEGIAAAETALHVSSLLSVDHAGLMGAVRTAVRAKEMFRRDVDYLITEQGALDIIDERTGRVLPGRRFADGLHQALEAKEAQVVVPRDRTLASISVQHLFRRYAHLSGMTGTAASEQQELWNTYQLQVVAVPPNRAVQRQDLDDLSFATSDDRDAAVIADVIVRKSAGQPVLLGTGSVEASERFSAALTAHGVAHNVLNAKNHHAEAEIVAQAGRLGAVTVTTNMAGRGTDILLGGAPELLARVALSRMQLTPGSPDWDHHLPLAVAAAGESCAAEGAAVRAAGGLHVLSAERSTSRRVDHQLRGRAGRQGDPGSSQFFVAFDDELLSSVSGMATLARLTADATAKQRYALTNRTVVKAQALLADMAAESRKQLVRFDDIIAAQRDAIWHDRQALLDMDSPEALLAGVIGPVAQRVADAITVGGPFSEDWDVESWLPRVAPLTGPLTVEELRELPQGLTVDTLAAVVVQLAQDRLLAQSAEFGEHLREVARLVLLQAIDEGWRDHLDSVAAASDGMGLRALARRDPVVEFTEETGELYSRMQARVLHTALERLLTARWSPHLPDELMAQANADLLELAPDTGQSPQSLGANELSGDGVQERPPLAVRELSPALPVTDVEPAAPSLNVAAPGTLDMSAGNEDAPARPAMLALPTAISRGHLPSIESSSIEQTTHLPAPAPDDTASEAALPSDEDRDRILP